MRIRALPCGKPSGHIDQERELHEFRRLEAEGADPHPAPRSASDLADAWDVHEDERDDRKDEGDQREFLEAAVVGEGEKTEEREPRQDAEQQLALHIVERAAAVLRRYGRRRRQEHHQAENQQETRKQEDPRIQGPQALPKGHGR